MLATRCAFHTFLCSLYYFVSNQYLSCSVLYICLWLTFLYTVSWLLIVICVITVLYVHLKWCWLNSVLFVSRLLFSHHQHYIGDPDLHAMDYTTMHSDSDSAQSDVTNRPQRARKMKRVESPAVTHPLIYPRTSWEYYHFGQKNLQFGSHRSNASSFLIESLTTRPSSITFLPR